MPHTISCGCCSVLTAVSMDGPRGSTGDRANLPLAKPRDVTSRTRAGMQAAGGAAPAPRALASRRQPRHHLTPREALGAGELLEPRLEGVVETGPLLNAGPSPLDEVPQPVAAPQGVLDEPLLGRAQYLVRNSADVRE